MSENVHFRVSPAVLGPLGIEQLQDPALAVLELVKNSWDACASRVEIRIESSDGNQRVSVADDGHGMSVEDFTSRWLVIGQSHKRSQRLSICNRPFIGEKGLGRLASFALGDAVTIESAPPDEVGFSSSIDWSKLSRSHSLEDYPVAVTQVRRPQGTTVTIENLKNRWQSVHTNFLVTHAQFLVSVPGEEFEIGLVVDGENHPIYDASRTIRRLVEATLDVSVGSDGSPEVTGCQVGDTDRSGISFRSMKTSERDPKLAGASFSLQFFRRDLARQLTDVLDRNEIVEALERYEGVRIFRDGINIPPYGLDGNDWAGLEKQRTATGGPTLVPGNSQLLGEVHTSRERHPHLVITAGRHGFADQSAVSSLANYVKWSARQLGTARRAARFGIVDRSRSVPGRVDAGRRRERTNADVVRSTLKELSKAASGTDPDLREKVEDAVSRVKNLVSEDESMLRLYAQLASTGIAATSFAHELRTEFDVVSHAVDEISSPDYVLDQELVGLLSSGWDRIRSFAGLFKVIPVKARRSRKNLTPTELRRSVSSVLGLVSADKVKTDVTIPNVTVRVVPADLDAILLNLVSNAQKAIDASANRDSGLLRIVLEVNGPDLHISVADNGCGISESVRTVMFEPLEGEFSEGTGMGLPIVAYISRRYRGSTQIGVPPPGYTTEIVVKMTNVVR